MGDSSRTKKICTRNVRRDFLFYKKCLLLLKLFLQMKEEAIFAFAIEGVL
jgi:hypothetical protein